MRLTPEQELEYLKRQYKVGDMVVCRYEFTKKYCKIKEINGLEDIVVVDKFGREHTVDYAMILANNTRR